MTRKQKQKLNIQLGLAILLTTSGIVLLFWGFLVNPLGTIDNSVLIAFGEVSTFAGALIGVEYSYRYKLYNKCKDICCEDKEEPTTPDYPND